MVKDTCCLWVHVCSVIGHALLERQNLCCLTALTPWLPGWVPGCREAQRQCSEGGKAQSKMWEMQSWLRGPQTCNEVGQWGVTEEQRTAQPGLDSIPSPRVPQLNSLLFCDSQKHLDVRKSENPTAQPCLMPGEP